MPDGDRRGERARLLALVGDELLRTGVATASLSGLARAVGSNNRMLLYYFGSKDNLVAESAAELGTRFPRLVNVSHEVQAPGPLLDRLTRAWEELVHPDNVPFMRLFFELFGMASHNPDQHGAILRSISGEWPAELAAAMRDSGASAADAERGATQVLVAWRGLQFELLSGADRAALDAAHAGLLRGILADLALPPPPF